MSNLTIRTATLDDTSTILKFITELATYEKAEHEVLATEDTIRSSLFGEKSHTYALICELDGVPIGSAIYFFNYSTWLAKAGLYLEDLYVSPEFRGQKAGINLLKALAKIAVEKDCARFEWSCLDWNTPAREFYEAIGAKSQDEWIGYRMSGETLSRFAQSPT